MFTPKFSCSELRPGDIIKTGTKPFLGLKGAEVMKANKIVILCALAMYVASFAAGIAVAAENRRLAFGISERLRPDNSLYYRLGVGDPGFPLPDPLLEQRIEQFVIPGGQVLNRTGRSFESAEFDSFNELAQAIFGQWEFKTADPSDPLAVETYLFSVQTFEITDITTARPEIYEPANGAVIDFPFQLRWNPLITSYIARGQDLVGSIDRVARGILDVNLVVSPNAINPYFTFELLHNGQSLLPFVSAVTSPMSPDFNLSIGSAAFTRVANITVYPRLVPEPHGLALLATCALSVILTSRKQRSFI